MGEERKPPSTSSVLWAEWRRGLKDLQDAVLNPWNGVTQKHEEPGAIASPTQAEVTADKGTVHGLRPELEAPGKDSFQQQVADAAARGRDGREQKGIER